MGSSSKTNKQKQPALSKSEVETLTAASPRNPNDVLLGRGKGAACWVGNIRYRNVIRDFVPRYQACVKNRDKIQMTTEIVQLIMKRGGRFLRFVGNGNINIDKDNENNFAHGDGDESKFALVSKEAARTKVAQALRHWKRVSSMDGGSSLETVENEDNALGADADTAANTAAVANETNNKKKAKTTRKRTRETKKSQTHQKKTKKQKKSKNDKIVQQDSRSHSGSQSSYTNVQAAAAAAMPSAEDIVSMPSSQDSQQEQDSDSDAVLVSFRDLEDVLPEDGDDVDEASFLSSVDNFFLPEDDLHGSQHEGNEQGHNTRETGRGELTSKSPKDCMIHKIPVSHQAVQNEETRTSHDRVLSTEADKNPCSLRTPPQMSLLDISSIARSQTNNTVTNKTLPFPETLHGTTSGGGMNSWRLLRQHSTLTPFSADDQPANPFLPARDNLVGAPAFSPRGVPLLPGVEDASSALASSLRNIGSYISDQDDDDERLFCEMIDDTLGCC